MQGKTANGSNWNKLWIWFLSFVYDGYKLIEERNALDNNAAVRKYVWQPEALDRDVPLTVYDAASEKTYYYHTNANKNVTELSDESGNIVAHYEYSPFGSLTKATGDYAGSNPFRFSSEYNDEETGLVYYNYRYYNPELGRWISRDPIEEQGGYNLYGMIENNLLISWDQLGNGKAGIVIRVAGKGGLKITKNVAKKILKQGKSIRVSGHGARKEAKRLMKEAGGKNTKIVRHDPHNPGQLPHYQPKHGGGVHAFYDTTKAFTAVGLLGDNFFTQFIDFFNPISDINEILDIIREAEEELAEEQRNMEECNHE